MKHVMISELKAHLSEYLAAVRAGETLVVCDRRTPVARIVPFNKQEPDDGLQAISATAPPSAINDVQPVRPLADVDVVAILRESRDQR